MVQLLIPPRGWIIPTSGTLCDLLSKVEGIYEISRREARSIVILAVILIAPLAFVVGNAWSDFEHGSRGSDAFTGGVGLITIALVMLWLLPRLWARYEFRQGHITKISGSGAVLWREQLSDVPRVVLSNDRINTFITLRWPERRRSFLVPDSLANAIDELQTGRHMKSKLPTPPTFEEFVRVSRDAFSFLSECGFSETPLPKQKFTNSFQVRFSNGKVVIVVEGMHYGQRALVYLEDLAGVRVPLYLFVPHEHRSVRAQRQAGEPDQCVQIRTDAQLVRDHCIDFVKGDMTRFYERASEWKRITGGDRSYQKRELP